jgi:hypothetical protein
VAEQTFKNSQHQVLTLNQLVQLLSWLKHGVLERVVAVELVQLTEVLDLVVVVERIPTDYLKPLTLEQQKP